MVAYCKSSYFMRLVPRACRIASWYPALCPIHSSNKNSFTAQATECNPCGKLINDHWWSLVSFQCFDKLLDHQPLKTNQSGHIFVTGWVGKATAEVTSLEPGPRRWHVKGGNARLQLRKADPSAFMIIYDRLLNHSNLMVFWYTFPVNQWDFSTRHCQDHIDTVWETSTPRWRVHLFERKPFWATPYGGFVKIGNPTNLWMT